LSQKKKEPSRYSW